MRHSGLPPFAKMTPAQRDVYWKRFWVWMNRDERVFQRVANLPPPAEHVPKPPRPRRAHRRNPNNPRKKPPCPE